MSMDRGYGSPVGLGYGLALCFEPQLLSLSLSLWMMFWILHLINPYLHFFPIPTADGR